MSEELAQAVVAKIGLTSITAKQLKEAVKTVGRTEMTTENINSGKEIIDAAQNAVMQAADDVSGIISENTAGNFTVTRKSSIKAPNSGSA